MKGSQLGATESGGNWIGYVIHHAPGPMLAVQPSVELAKRFSQQRIDPLIEESPVLREKVAPARSRDSGNTVLSKEFPGGILVMTGANRPSACARCRCATCFSMRSTPIRRRPTTRAIRWRWRKRGRGRSPGGARCSSPRRRPSRVCRGSSGNTRPRISGGSSCRARTAASVNGSGSSGCAGRRASRRRRPITARAASSRSPSTTRRRCWQQASGGRRRPRPIH